MDVLLRNIDEHTVEIIDKKAKKKGVSRNELINTYLDTVVFNEEYKTKEEEIKYALNKLTNAFEFTQQRLGSLENNLENIFLLLSISAGIDIQDIPSIIDNYKNGGEIK